MFEKGFSWNDAIVHKLGIAETNLQVFVLLLLFITVFRRLPETRKNSSVI